MIVGVPKEIKVNENRVAVIPVGVELLKASGHTVFVEKGGEIIPKITGVDISKRPDDSIPVNYIKKCPECSTNLIWSAGLSP